MENPETYHTII